MFIPHRTSWKWLLKNFIYFYILWAQHNISSRLFPRRGVCIKALIINRNVNLNFLCFILNFNFCFLFRWFWQSSSFNYTTVITYLVLNTYASLTLISVTSGSHTWWSRVFICYYPNRRCLSWNLLIVFLSWTMIAFSKSMCRFSKQSWWTPSTTIVFLLIIKILLINHLYLRVSKHVTCIVISHNIYLWHISVIAISYI